MSVNDSSRLGSAVLGRARLAGYETPSSGYTFNDSFSILDSFQFVLSGSQFEFDESLVFNDSFSFLLTFVLTLNDDQSGNWNDLLIFPGAILPLVLNDSLDSLFLDAIQTPVTQPALLIQGDALVILDGFFPLFPFDEIYNDSLVGLFLDSIIVQNLYVVNIDFPTDGINLQDGIILNLATVIGLSINDSFTLSDFIDDVISLPLQLTDNIRNWGDNILLGGTDGQSLNLGDYYILGDGISPLLTMRFLLNDSVTFADGTAESLSNTGATEIFNDSYVIQDSLFLFNLVVLNLLINDDQSGNWNDSIIQSIPEPLNNYLRRYLNDVV